MTTPTLTPAGEATPGPSSRPAPQVATPGLPAPRLQLRWALPTKGERDWSFAPGEPEADGYRRWVCHYELVLPLHKHDIRCERDDGPDVAELVIPISKTDRGSTRPPDDDPYRDGVHAGLDSAHLGNPPIYVLPYSGAPVLLSDLRAARMSALALAHGAAPAGGANPEEKS